MRDESNDLRDLLDLACATEWDADGDDLLICPHGHRVELDGECPEGCVSPQIVIGLI